MTQTWTQRNLLPISLCASIAFIACIVGAAPEFDTQARFRVLAGTARLTPSSVVFVRTDRGSGTGIVVDGGRVLTAGHVVSGAAEVWVTFEGRAGNQPLELRAGGWQWGVANRDLAIITGVNIPGSVTPARLASKRPVVADVLTSIGLESPSAVRLRTAPVSGLQDGGIAIAVQAQPGDSGGPVLNEAGELVGINSATGTQSKFESRTTTTPGGTTFSYRTWTEPATYIVDLTDISFAPR